MWCLFLSNDPLCREATLMEVCADRAALDYEAIVDRNLVEDGERTHSDLIFYRGIPEMDMYYYAQWFAVRHAPEGDN